MGSIITSTLGLPHGKSMAAEESLQKGYLCAAFGGGSPCLWRIWRAVRSRPRRTSCSVASLYSDSRAISSMCSVAPPSSSSLCPPAPSCAVPAPCACQHRWGYSVMAQAALQTYPPQRVTSSLAKLPTAWSPEWQSSQPPAHPTKHPSPMAELLLMMHATSHVSGPCCG